MMQEAAQWIEVICWRSLQAGGLAACVLLLWGMRHRRRPLVLSRLLGWLVVARALLLVGPSSVWGLFPASLPTLRSPAPTTIEANGRIMPHSLPTAPAAAPLSVKPPLAADRHRQWNAPMILMIVWGVGAGRLISLAAVQWVRFHRRLQADHEEAPINWQQVLQECCELAGIRRPVRFWLTDATAGPALWQGLKPTILFPRRQRDDWSESALRLALLHELAHLRRHDVLLQTVLLLTRVLHWFNPLVVGVIRRLEEAREQACDRMVLDWQGWSKRKEYGTMLIQAAVRGQSAPTLAMSQAGRELRRRIEQLALGRPSRPAMSWQHGALFMMLGVIVLTDGSRADDRTKATPTNAGSPTFVGSSILTCSDLDLHQPEANVITKVYAVGDLLDLLKEEAPDRALARAALQQMIDPRQKYSQYHLANEALVVRAEEAKHAQIANVFQAWRTTGLVQLMLEAYVAETTTAAWDRQAAELFGPNAQWLPVAESNGPTQALVVSAPQRQRLVERWRSKDPQAQLISAPKVTVFNGQSVTIAIGNQAMYLDDQRRLAQTDVVSNAWQIIMTKQPTSAIALSMDYNSTRIDAANNPTTNVLVDGLSRCVFAQRPSLTQQRLQTAVELSPGSSLLLAQSGSDVSKVTLHLFTATELAEPGRQGLAPPPANAN